MKKRDIILKKLHKALDMKLKRLCFVVSETNYPDNAEFLIHSRLIIILKGSKNAFLPLSTGRQNVHLEKGDMLYCLPKSWEKHEWIGEYEMLCIVPRKDYLRVSLYVSNSLDNKIRPQAIFHHTGLPYPETMRHLLGAMNTAWKIKNVNTYEYLVKALISMAINECEKKAFNSEGHAQILYNRVRNWIVNSFQEDINRSIVANVFGISPGYVSQLFKKYSGSSFQEFLTTCRMDYARELLETTNLTGYQIARLAGYNDYVHFVRHFRTRNGLSPQKYRSSSNL